jgi:hypothetical protein
MLEQGRDILSGGDGARLGGRRTDRPAHPSPGVLDQPHPSLITPVSTRRTDDLDLRSRSGHC